MKLLYLALIGCAGAIKLTQEAPHSPQLVEVEAEAFALPRKGEAMREIRKFIDDHGQMTWKDLKRGLKAWEKDSGKEITKEEWAKVKEAFKITDTNKNGAVDAAEFEASLEA